MRRRPRHAHVLVLEDGRARAPNRVLRAPGRPKPRPSKSEPSRRTSRRRSSPRPRSPSSSSAGASSRTSNACAASCATRRDAMIAALERTFPDDASWSRPEGGYFVWLELGDGTRRLRARSARCRERRRHRAGPGLLPARLGPRRLVRAARVQLRDARADRRGRRASRDAALASGSTPATRSRALEEKAADEADRDAEEDEHEQRDRRREEDEVHPDLLAVLERDDDGVEREHARGRSASTECRASSSGLESGPSTRRILRGVTDGDARQRPRHELGLPRWRENAGLRRAEGRARLIPGKRAEALASEVSSRRRWPVSVSSSFSEGRPSTTSPHSVEPTRFGQPPSRDKSPAICGCSQNSKKTCKFSNSWQTLSASATPVENSPQG